MGRNIIGIYIKIWVYWRGAERKVDEFVWTCRAGNTLIFMYTTSDNRRKKKKWGQEPREPPHTVQLAAGGQAGSAGGPDPFPSVWLLPLPLLLRWLCYFWRKKITTLGMQWSLKNIPIRHQTSIKVILKALGGLIQSGWPWVGGQGLAGEKFFSPAVLTFRP